MTQLKTLSSTNPKLAMHTTYKNEIIVFLPTFTPFPNVQPQKFTQKNFSTSEPIGETIPCSILPNFPLGKAKKNPISSPAISSSPSHEAAAEVVASSKFHAAIPRIHAAGNLAVHQYSPLSEPKLDILPPKPHPPTFEKRISAYVDLTAKSRTPHKFKHRIPILLESTGFTVQGGLVS